MANKKYVKPEITVVDLEIESLLTAFSGEDNSGVHTTPDDNAPVTGGDADAKGFWGSTWDD